MTRQNKLIILAAYLAILAVVLPVYLMKRRTADNRLKAEITRTKGELDKIASVSLEADRLRRLFPVDVGAASFIEDLYTAAKTSNLTVHEASSEMTVSRPTPRTPQPTEELSSVLLKIKIEGSYRSIAEYIRRIQNIERFKRISEIKLASGKNGVSGSLAIELYALKGQHAR